MCDELPPSCGLDERVARHQTAKLYASLFRVQDLGDAIERRQLLY
jgi:hypothetical protein